MNCEKCKEHLVEYIENLLDEPLRKELEEHLETCPDCQKELQEIQQLQSNLEQSSQTLQTDLESQVLGSIIRQQKQQLKQAQKKHTSFSLWRTIMKSNITKYAIAACLVAAAFIGFNIPITSPVYGIIDTVEAYHSVRYLHIKSFMQRIPDAPVECWIQADSFGELEKARIHKPAWMDPDDGDTVIVWENNKATCWVKKKNILLTLQDQEIKKQILFMLEMLDPKQTAQNILEGKDDGELDVKIEKPESKSDPIEVTADFLIKTELPVDRVVLYIDQATKLINSLETFQLQNEEYVHFSTIEFFDYNIPIDPEMFTFDNIPDNVTRVDQTTQDVGLEQGELSDNEIAQEVIRQFLQALIKEDYAQAGKVWGGVPAENVKVTYGQTRFIRIVSIGEPEKRPKMNALFVPCTIEIEENGKITEWTPEHAYVRRIHGQERRWEIIGGFKGIYLGN